jgi:hypothetical protein
MLAARRILTVSVLALLASATAQAQQPPASPPAIDPAAIAALSRMGEFLRKHNSMEVKAETRTDEVLESGQKVQITAQMDLKVRRPDRLRLLKASDRKTREFFYDGKTFTIYGVKTGYYAQVPAPPTVQQLVEVIGRRYGIEMPLADLFYWGTEKSGVEDIREATNVGPSTVGGALCDHYAFRQRDVDWQIWIQQGAEPLPRKLLVTTVDDPAKPQHEVDMTWTLNPKFDDKLFVFVPPKNALPIAIDDAEAMTRPARQGRAPRPAGGAR